MEVYLCGQLISISNKNSIIASHNIKNACTIINILYAHYQSIEHVQL